MDYRAQGITASAALDRSDLQRMRRTKDLDGLAGEFEALLTERLLKVMRRTVPEGGLFPKSLQKDLFTELFDRELARKLAHGRGLGLARVISRSLGAAMVGPAPEAWVWPVEGEPEVLFGELDADGGLSTELITRVAEGTTVFAPAAGRVVSVDEDRIVLEHGGGFRSEVSGVVDLTLRPGDPVVGGAPLGRAGRRGLVGFAVSQDGEPMDPSSLPMVQRKLRSLAQGFPISDDVVDENLAARE